jgi:hypothetical protein
MGAGGHERSCATDSHVVVELDDATAIERRRSALRSDGHERQ